MTWVDVVVLLGYLHWIGLEDRDAKRDNILIQTYGHVTLRDFYRSLKLHTDIRNPKRHQKLICLCHSKMDIGSTEGQAIQTASWAADYVTADVLRGETHAFGNVADLF